MTITRHVPKVRSMRQGKAAYSNGLGEAHEFNTVEELLKVPFVAEEAARAEFSKFVVHGIMKSPKLLVAERIGRMPIVIGELSGEGIEGLSL